MDEQLVMTNPSWLTTLVEGYAWEDPQLPGYINRYPDLGSAWNGTGLNLLVWLAARLANRTSDLRAVLATATLLVDQRVSKVDPAHCNLGEVLSYVRSLDAASLDYDAVRSQTSNAHVSYLVASSLSNLLSAASRIAEIDTDDPPGPSSLREIPSLLSEAVRDAENAFGNFCSIQGAYARMSGGDKVVRGRHTLQNGRVVARMLS